MDSAKSKVRKRKAALNVTFCVKKEKNIMYKKVSTILRKPLSDRSIEEAEFLKNSDDVVQEICNRRAQRQKAKERAQEYEDAPEVLTDKCRSLAEAVLNSNHLVVYTGAGISTAARIPDYRGTNGIWTLLEQGKDIGLHDLSTAEPTLTHMGLYCLYRSGILKHVVSQNCDGLHIRSGLPRTVLSEVHGNMYLEVCTKCKPHSHYMRLFDVTENTARFNHETLRLCANCGSPLHDTIVHFGERGKLQWPLNWKTACEQADKADVIVCLGSSLKVLKRYPWLWCMDKPVKKRPKLYIVNLQWTPKDHLSALKINGKCDEVMNNVMAHLGLTIPQYIRTLDPIFHHASLLHDLEMHTTTRSPIQRLRDKMTDGREIEVKVEQLDDDAVVKSEDIGDADLDLLVVEPLVVLTEYETNDLPVGKLDALPDPELLLLGDWNCAVGLRHLLNAHLLEAYMRYAQYFVSSGNDMEVSTLSAPGPVDSEFDAPCEFCAKYYNANGCLFYVTREPAEPSTSAGACLCCGDDDTPEEEAVSDESPVKAPNVNPGWFGKGYRKRMRKRK